jgi:hypothetical protein
MFDKLFVRVRSWLHAGPQPVTAGAGAFPAGDYRGVGSGSPPPLPPDAWMESESGMVITESGIIIIDPALADAPANSAPPPPPRGVPADRAWAMPTLPRAGSGSSTTLPTLPNGTPASTSSASRSVTPTEDMDWDEVLARARANISRAKAPEARAKTPEARAKTPEPRTRTPEPHAKTPEKPQPPTRGARSPGRKK